jgi:hypothetical protein
MTSEGRARSLQNLRPWQKGETGNPGGRISKDVEDARQTIRDFMLRGGGMERWVALTEHKNPMIRMYVFRDLMKYGFGLPPQEYRVERHASTVNVHVGAVADPAKYSAVEEVRAKMRALLLDTAPSTNGTSTEDADGGPAPADGCGEAPADS